MTSVSSEDVITAFQEKLSEANYEIAVLRARLAAIERREKAEAVAPAPAPVITALPDQVPVDVSKP